MNIVLVHGIFGFREKFGLEYFHAVAEHFRVQGFNVLVTELDPTRGIEFRGHQLGDHINNFKPASGFANRRPHRQTLGSAPFPSSSVHP